MEAFMIVQRPTATEVPPRCPPLPPSPNIYHGLALQTPGKDFGSRGIFSWIFSNIGARLGADSFVFDCLRFTHDWFCLILKFTWWIFRESCCKAMRDWERHFLYICIHVHFFNLWWVVLKNMFLWILVPVTCLPIRLKLFLLGFVYTLFIVLYLVVFPPKWAPGVSLLFFDHEGVIRFLVCSVGSKDEFFYET